MQLLKPLTPIALACAALLLSSCSTEPDLVETAGAPRTDPMADTSTERAVPTPAPESVAQSTHLPAIDRHVLQTYGPGKFETATFALG